MKKLTHLFIIIVVCFNLVGCTTNEVKPPTEDNDANYIELVNRFAWTSSAALLVSEENSNYSPLSLYLALAMLAPGSNGNTQEQLLSILNLSDIDYDLDFITKQSSILLQTVKSKKDLSLNNSLWIQENFDVNKEYKKIIETDFYGELFSIDFQKKADLKKIVDWVAKNTNDRIQTDTQGFSEHVFMLINTIYYKSSWETPFTENRTTKDIFYLSDGAEIELDYMNKNENGAILNTDNYQASYLKLKEGTMYFILPNEGIEINQLLSSEELPNVLKHGQYENGKINYQIPKFEYSNSYDLKELMLQLGATDIFEEDADLSGIADDLFISSITQDTFIKVDEKGAEAAGSTIIGGNTTSAPIDEPIEFILNRPFIYVITNEEGFITFIGAYYGK